MPEAEAAEQALCEKTASELLIRRLVAAHASFYNFEEPHLEAGHTFAAYGEFHEEAISYVAIKAIKMWGVNSHDYLYVYQAQNFEEAQAEQLIEFMNTHALEHVNAGPEHMSSSRTLVVVADSATDGARKLFQKTKHRKSFKFSIQGWSDLRLALIDMSQPSGSKDQTVWNAAGKALERVIAGNLALTSA